jgi:hypothetical protein
VKPGTGDPAPLEGRVYTTGNSFRAKAEAHQRQWRRGQRLQPGKYGHHLTEADARIGRALALPRIREAIEQRHRAGKGVDLDRTLGNLLSSQALAFNLFTPLVPDGRQLADAAKVLAPFLPGMRTVVDLQVEYTPPNAILGDQSGRGGVDADVRIDFRHEDGGRGLLLIEVKYAEDAFSVCGYRKPDHVEPCTVPLLIPSAANCRYSTRRTPYRYWERALDLQVLKRESVIGLQCPFSGPLWQPWVHVTLAPGLAHHEGQQAGAEPFAHVWYAVLAPAANREVLEHDGMFVLDGLRALLVEPQHVHHVDLDTLLDSLQTPDTLGGAEGELGTWATFLRDRYRTPAPT